MSIFGDAWNWIKSAATSTATGAEEYTEGWKDIFTGHGTTGINELNFALPMALGFTSPQEQKAAGEALDAAMQWGFNKAVKSKEPTCISAVVARAEAEFRNEGLPWSDKASDTVHKQIAESLEGNKGAERYYDVNC